MKLIGTHWQNVLSHLPAWETLPAEARVSFLKVVQPGKLIARADLGEHLEPLMQAGFLMSCIDRQRVMVPKPVHPFWRFMDDLRSHPLQDANNAEAFARYYSENFSYQEQTAFQRAHPQGYDPKWLFKRVCSRYWLQEFLSASDRRWEQNYLEGYGRRPYFSSPEVFSTTQNILRSLIGGNGAIPLKDLNGTWSASTVMLSDAIQAGIRYLLFFPRIREGDYAPVLGVWPGIEEVIRRPKPGPPATVQPVEVFYAAFLMQDMTSLMVACASEPLPLRDQDGDLYAKRRREIEQHLLPLPQWLEQTFNFSPEYRIRNARKSLESLAFVSSADQYGSYLNPTQAGQQWLGFSAPGRLKSLLDAWRNARGGPVDHFRRTDAFLPVSIHLAGSASAQDFEKRVAHAFAQVPMDFFVSVSGFLTYHVEHDNPLRQIKNIGYCQFGSSSLWHPTEQDLDEAWSRVLHDFLYLRLLPSGGARVGFDADKNFCFQLTGAGRYLLGLAADFEMATEPPGEVIVQPNFEVMFLAPKPAAEFEIARFAERKGRHVGLVFKITRASIFAAAAAGGSAAQVVQVLKQFCSREVPDNVEHEIRNWFARCRRVSFRSALLIECPDAETAAKVISADKKNVVPVTDRIVELRAHKERNQLTRKLRGMGIFV